jgi:copper transport protein
MKRSLYNRQVRNTICTFMTRRRSQILSPAFALAIVLMLLTAANVRAHARLESSSVAPGAVLSSVPNEIVFDFTEPVDLAYSRASLIHAGGVEVSSVTLTVDPADPTRIALTINAPSLPSGAYAIVWRVLSATDAHATTGSLAFSAGTGTAPDIASTTSAISAPWSTVTARWFELVALLAITGTLGFAVLSAATVVRDSQFVGAMRLIILVSSGLGLAGTVVSSIAIAVAANDHSWQDLPSIGEWRATLTDTDVGRAVAIRAAFFVLALLIVLLLGPLYSRTRFVLAALISIAALSSFSLTGHARATSRPALAVSVDLAHLIAVSLWGGGIALLALYIFRQMASHETASFERISSAISRFSLIALVAMAVIICSGVVSSAFHISGPRNLTGEAYGRTVIAKVLLVAMVLVVAGTNRLFIVPRLKASLSELPQIVRAHTNRLRLTALLEVAAALLILFAAARLTELPPADGPLTVDVAGRQGPISLSAVASDLTITLSGQLDPAAADTIIIQVTDATGQPVSDLARVIVLATAPDPLDASGDALRDRFDATPIDNTPGAYAFPRTRLGIQTDWSLEVTARRLGLSDASTNFDLDLTGAGTQPPRLVADQWKWPKLPWSGWLALAAAAATFAGGITLIKRLKGLEPVTGAIFLSVIALISGAFAFSAYRSGPIPTTGSNLQNPLDPSDAAIITRASETFATQCASCHGATGQGLDEGEAPEHGHQGGGDRDLTTSQSQQLSDGDLYTIVTDGIGGTEMPSFSIALTEDQRWEIVILIREFQKQAEAATP